MLRKKLTSVSPSHNWHIIELLNIILVKENSKCSNIRPRLLVSPSIEAKLAGKCGRYHHNTNSVDNSY